MRSGQGPSSEVKQNHFETWGRARRSIRGGNPIGLRCGLAAHQRVGLFRGIPSVIRDCPGINLDQVFTKRKPTPCNLWASLARVLLAKLSPSLLQGLDNGLVG